MTGYAVHHLQSPEGQTILSRYKLTCDDISKALDLYHRDGTLVIRTVIGVSGDGLIGNERNGWHPQLPDAFANGFVVVPWVQVLELLGCVPDNSTEAFLDGKAQTRQ